MKLVLAARRRRASSSRSPAVTGGSRESVTGSISGGSDFWACATTGSAARNRAHNRILITSPPPLTGRCTLVPNLGRGVPQLGNAAVASLCDKPRVRIQIARYHSCRQHPRLQQHLRVFDRNDIQEHIALAR